MKISYGIWILLASAAAGGVIDWRTSLALTREVTVAERRVAALRRTVAAEEASTTEQKRAERAAEEKWDLVAAERAVEQRYGPAPAKVWRSRVAAVQDAFAKAPGEPVPELALLQLKDWIDAAVRAEGASPEQLRKVFAALRWTARVRAAEKIQDALKRYLAGSGGLPPTDVQQLVPLLPTTITAEMLAPYAVILTGRPTQPDDLVLEAKFGIATLAIKPNGWTSKAQSGAESVNETFAVLSGLGGKMRNEQFETLKALMAQAMQRFGPVMAQAMPDTMMQNFGPQAKVAIKQYMAAHGGEPPHTLADLASILPATATLAQAMRPAMAEFEYALEHEGAAPTDPKRLQRYLDALDDTHLLRRMRLTVNGEHFNLDFDFNY